MKSGNLSTQGFRGNPKKAREGGLSLAQCSDFDGIEAFKGCMGSGLPRDALGHPLLRFSADEALPVGGGGGDRRQKADWGLIAIMRRGAPETRWLE